MHRMYLLLSNYHNHFQCLILRWLLKCWGGIAAQPIANQLPINTLIECTVGASLTKDQLNKMHAQY